MNTITVRSVHGEVFDYDGIDSVAFVNADTHGNPDFLATRMNLKEGAVLWVNSSHFLTCVCDAEHVSD